jgi:hypothetical protein
LSNTDIPIEMVIQLHTGYLSADNGAGGPLSIFFDIPKITTHPSRAEIGDGYASDSLVIDARDWLAVEEILVECKMLYRIKGVDEIDRWRNVQTNEVRRKLRLPEVHDAEDAPAMDRPSA